MSIYQELSKWLHDRGIDSYQQVEDADHLILSDQNPACPTSNCLWVKKRGDDWYIGTWLPSAYRLPKTEEVGRVCETVFRSSATAMYTIDPAIAERFQLHRLGDDEMEQLGFA